MTEIMNRKKKVDKRYEKRAVEIEGEIFCFKQKTAYEMRISDWSSDVCSSDLRAVIGVGDHRRIGGVGETRPAEDAALLLGGLAGGEEQGAAARSEDRQSVV